MNNDKV